MIIALHTLRIISHKIIELSEIKFELKEIFKIYDYIESITITGGEPLLYKELTEVLKETLLYSSQFTTCRVFTNGTIIPNEKLLNVFKENPEKLQFVIDDYGPEHSIHAYDIRELTKRVGLKCRTNQYFGDDQHCGGWVNYGLLSKYRDYSNEEVDSLIKHCHNAT